jgi:Undecaprenyl-phosphate glucose phosphotransferase
MLKENSNFFLAILTICDLIVFFFAYLAAAYLTVGLSMFSSVKDFIIPIVINCLFLLVYEKFEFSHSYRFRPFSLIFKNLLLLYMVVVSVIYTLILTGLYKYSSRFVIIYTGIFMSIFLVARLFIKIFLHIIRSKGYNFRRYLIIGAGKVGLSFYRKVKRNNKLGIKIIGFLDDNPDILNHPGHEYTDEVKKLILGSTDKLENVLKTIAVDNVVLALPMYANKKIVDITNLCEKYGVKAELIPDYFKIISRNPSMRQIQGYPLIGIRNVPLENMFNRFIKRLCDLTLSLIAFIVLLPLFGIIAVGIKLTSKGPVFFKQKRTGFLQRDFEIIKFRTMVVNNDADKVQATKDDPRKTKFGDFLRKTNLDELPQILNIIRGEMSIVGPRPHMLTHTEEFYQKYDKYLVRHWVKPGLTGWAQVNGWRGDSDIGMRIKYDIDYIENWTFFLDVKIIFLTVFGRKVKRYAY